MIQGKSSLIWCSISFIIFGCSSLAHDKTIDSNSLSTTIINGNLAIRLNMLLIEEINKEFTGTALVAKDGHIILQNGYGWTDSTRTTPVTPNTGFYIASTTKGITGMAAVLAENMQLLSLHDSIDQYFTNVPDLFDSVSIHEMLIHTSGLRNNYESFGHTNLKENVTQVLSDSLTEKGNFVYTSAGYWLTAAIIEQRAQMPYERFIQKEIFIPAGMTNTYFWHEIDDNDSRLYALKLFPFPPVGTSPNWGFRGSGGLVSTAPDLYRYFLLFSSTGKFNSKSREKLIGPHFMLGSGIGIGYGWFTTITERGTREIWSRGGESFGHNSVIRWFVDEDVVIIVLTASGIMDGESMEANRVISNKLEQIIFMDHDSD